MNAAKYIPLACITYAGILLWYSVVMGVYMPTAKAIFAKKEAIVPIAETYDGLYFEGNNLAEDDLIQSATIMMMLDTIPSNIPIISNEWIGTSFQLRVVPASNQSTKITVGVVSTLD